MSGKLVARKVSTDGTEAIRVADDSERSSSADVTTEGNVMETILGHAPRGEAGTLDVCAILVERLNQEGAHWTAPSHPKGQEVGIDCEAKDGSRVLQVQVTRLPNSTLWEQLGRAGTVTLDRSLEEAAKDLRLAIRHKETIPPSQCADITLAINALDTIGHAVNGVAEAFRHMYGKEVAALGFKAVWVVGPVPALTMRLDAP